MFLINMRMKFVTDNNLKSGDEVNSLKETFGLCEGRAEQHHYITCESNLIHVRIWLVKQCSGICGRSCMDYADNNHVCNWPVE